MKVLHVLSSNKFSGAENVVCQIIKMFSDCQEIEMAYASVDGPIRDSLSERGIVFFPIQKLCKKQLSEIVSIYKPDIIHAHDRMASYISATLNTKTPILVHMHVNNNRGLKLLIKNFIWYLKSYRYRHIFWVSNSSFYGFQFHKKLSKKSSILYNVIDSSSVHSRCKEDLRNYDDDIVYCGRLTYQKNPI